MEESKVNVGDCVANVKLPGVAEISVPTVGCKDCPWIITIREKQNENITKLASVDTAVTNKVSWSVFTWIIAGLSVAFIIAMGFNFNLLSQVNAAQHRMELCQVVMAKDIEIMKAQFPNIPKK